MEILVIGDGTGDIHDNIQVYSPILQVCTHPAMSPEHTHQLQIHAHTVNTPQSSGQPFLLRRPGKNGA